LKVAIELIAAFLLPSAAGFACLGGGQSSVVAAGDKTAPGGKDSMETCTDGSRNTRPVRNE